METESQEQGGRGSPALTLGELDTADRVYAVMRALGASQREAAGSAGFSRSTGSRREKNGWWCRVQEEIRAQFDDAEGHKALSPLQFLVIRTLGKRLFEGDLAAARYVADRLWGKATTAQNPAPAAAAPDLDAPLTPEENALIERLGIGLAHGTDGQTLES